MKNLMVRVVTLHRLAARLVAIVLFAALLSATPFQAAFAQAPSLGSAGNFAVLGGPAVTCTNSTINGDVGSGLASSIVTKTNCTINGTVHQGDATSIAAYNDFLSAYNAFAAIECTSWPTESNLASQVLDPGVHCFEASSTSLNGTLTLSGPSDGIWIFKIGTLGTGALTGTNFSVVMAGGGQPCNVYWLVAEGSTLTTSFFLGNILAGAATTFTGGSLIGRALAKAGVTMTDAAVVFGCSSPVPPVCQECQVCPDCNNYCNDHWQEYWKEYWKDYDKYHCKDHEKDYCKHHYCTNHDKDRCKDHDKDNYKNKDNDKDNRNRR